MKLFSLLLRLLLLALVLTGTVGPAPAQTLEEKVGEYVLANGLRLLTVERHESPTFAAYITIGVGSVNETSRNRGVAHLLEHMLFKGTKTIGTTDYRQEKPILDAIAQVGAEVDRLRETRPEEKGRILELERRLEELQARHRSFVVKDEFSKIYGENGGVGFNAFTSKDLTTYMISLPANKMELWAALESDRMENAVLREFYIERDVVMEERRRSYDSDPGGLLYENLMANAFIMHPYRNPIIGWMSDIRTLTLEETRDFFHKYYSPVNTVIALVGDFETAEARRLVNDYFGDIPSGEPVPPVVSDEPEQLGEKRFQVRFDAEPQVSLAFHKPTLPDQADYAFDLIDHILGQGPTSRLYRSLVLDKGLAASISTYGAPGSRYPNLFVISAVPQSPHTPAEVEAAIFAELDRLATEPVTAEELEEARNRLRTDRLRYLRGNNGLARMLTYYQTVAGDWRYLLTYDQKVAEISAEDVMATAGRYLTTRNRTIGTVGRKGGKP